MTREEVAEMLTLLRVSYPAFYSKMRKDDMVLIVDIWSEMFRDDDLNIVKYALKELIATHSGYPPDIAAVKKKLRELVSTANGDPTDEDLWLMLKRAVKNGLYGAKEEFEKLPPVLQRYCGSPATLREFALIDSDTFNTVNHGQFLKQIKIIKDREEYEQKIPDGVKKLIAANYTPLVEKRPMTLPEFNEKRNEILNALAEGGGKDDCQ